MSSRDVVTKIVHTIRGATGEKIKAGHAGTLDPRATGVLLVCLGKATKLIQFMQQSPKTYEAAFRLDVTSDSADLETAVSPIPNPVQPTLELIESHLAEFTGTIQQTPPAYSAVSINGQRAYKLARKGLEVNLQSKPVEIHSLQVDSYVYPDLRMTIRCGSGTYIRSLGKDLANSFGSDAVMTDLVRTSIGDFKLNDATSLNDISIELIRDNLQAPIRGAGAMPWIELSAAEQELIRSGRFLDSARFGLQEESAARIAAVNDQSELLAILEWRDDQLKPLINIA